MKLKHSQACGLLAAALMVSAVPTVMAAAAPAPAKPADAKAAPKEPVAPKSVFAIDPKKGKDPFFPKSERWNPPPVVPKVNPAIPVAPVVPVKKDPYKHFELKGFVKAGSNQVATISSGLRNYIVVLGESKMAVTPDGNYRFKIVRYTDSGVVIQIEGEKEEKELKLPTP